MHTSTTPERPTSEQAEERRLQTTLQQDEVYEFVEDDAQSVTERNKVIENDNATPYKQSFCGV